MRRSLFLHVFPFFFCSVPFSVLCLFPGSLIFCSVFFAPHTPHTLGFSHWLSPVRELYQYLRFQVMSQNFVLETHTFRVRHDFEGQKMPPPWGSRGSGFHSLFLGHKVGFAF